MKTQLNNLFLLGFLLTTTLLSGFLSSCERLVPDVREEQEMMLAASYNPPLNPCGTSIFHDLLTLGDDSFIGTVELQNDDSQMYLSVDPSQGWLVSHFALFAGGYSSIPERAGICDLESFPYNVVLNSPEQVETISISLDNLDSCFDLCLWVEIVQLDNWGNVINRKEAFMAGQSYANLAYQSYCVQSCN